MAAGAQSLRLLGYDDKLYDISYQDGALVVSAVWPLHQMLFERDKCGCAGWEWLTRHDNVLPSY